MVWPQRSPSADGGLGLPAGQRVDAGADDLGDHRAVVQRQTRDDAGQRQVLRREDVVRRVEEVREDHHDQHGHGAEELDDHRARPPDPAVMGQPADAEHEAEHQRQHDRHAPPPSTCPARPAARRSSRGSPVRNGSHFAAVSWPLVVQSRVDHPAASSHQHDRDDAEITRLRDPGARARVRRRGPMDRLAQRSSSPPPIACRANRTTTPSAASG